MADEKGRQTGSTSALKRALFQTMGARVPASVLYMSMSVDGYIADPNDEPGNPGGDGSMRLHEWFVTADGEFYRPAGPAGQLVDELSTTGAVLAGRLTVEQAEHWGGDHHGVPIFVPSHRPPDPIVANYPLVTYVTGRDRRCHGASEGCGRGPERDGARRDARSRPACSTSCRSTRSRCCSAPGAGCSRCCRRGSSWRSSAWSTRRTRPTSATASGAEAGQGRTPPRCRRGNGRRHRGRCATPGPVRCARPGAPPQSHYAAPGPGALDEHGC